MAKLPTQCSYGSRALAEGSVLLPLLTFTISLLNRHRDPLPRSTLSSSIITSVTLYASTADSRGKLSNSWHAADILNFVHIQIPTYPKYPHLSWSMDSHGIHQEQKLGKFELEDARRVQ
jgi:hypothetical protein